MGAGRSGLIRVESSGERFVVLQARDADDGDERDDGGDPLASLGFTPAEREVADLLLEGLGNAAIARHRSVSARTIANQLASIFRKASVESRVALVAKLNGGTSVRVRGAPRRR